VGRYLLSFNGHDGRTAAHANLSDHRFFCANVVRAALASGITIRVHHKGDVALAMEKARDAIANVSEDFRRTIETYRAMARRRLSDAQVDALFRETFPLPPDKAEWSARRQTKIEAMHRLMIEGRGNGEGSLWDWYNGVTDFLD